MGRPKTPHIGRSARSVLAAFSLLAAAAGMAAATGTAPAAAAVKVPVTKMAGSAAPAHIMTIMMENTDYSQFAGAAAMPYLNQIAHEYATYTDAYGWTYPSLPNYLELLSGSDDGTAGQDCDITQAGCNNFTNPTLVDQLDAKGSAGTPTTRVTRAAATRAMAPGTTRTGTTPSGTSRTSTSSALTSRTSLTCSPT